MYVEDRVSTITLDTQVKKLKKKKNRAFENSALPEGVI